MREKPILFSAPMVRALLAGTKTQTRRTIKPQPFAGMTDDQVYLKFREQGVLGPDESLTWLVNCAWESGFVDLTCPYGQPGDRLWVREAWRIGAWDVDDGRIAVDYRDSVDKKWRDIPDDGKDAFVTLWEQCCDELTAKGIDPDTDGEYHWKPGESPLRWRPSIHMYRWASRITLEVTGVRVERLNDISDEDARAEGINRIAHGREGYFYHATRTEPHPNNWCFPDDAYKDLWEQINGPGSWAANPWVWVIEFKRVPQ